MRTMTIDIETYSAADIKKGVHKYVSSPSFDILLLSYAFDAGEVQTIDLASGEKISESVMHALFSTDVKKTAYNASFEMVCLGKYLHRPIDLSQWECDMVRACYNGYPPGLGVTAKALGLPEDKQKDARGKRLIQYFCKPCKPTKANGGRTRNLPADAPEDWEVFKEYNRQDVVTEMAIRKALTVEVPEKEWRLWRMDQQINDRGIGIDADLVENAIRINEDESARMLAEAQKLTGLPNPNSHVRLKKWLAERGYEVASLNKDALAELLKDESLPSDVRHVLRLRARLGKTSIKKYEAMADTVTEDGRAHDLFQFYGTHTGRWAGRNIQLQNLTRNSMQGLDLARKLVKDGDEDSLAFLYENITDVLSQLVRTALVPGEGCHFIVADFSAIEARVIAWVAGVKWRQEAFAKGEDIYCASASSMFSVPVVKHGVNGELRQKGKVAELACVAKGQQVLTDHGLKPIEEVALNDLVWDGAEFVRHEGLVCKGYREVMTYEGLTATPDHLVFIEGKPRPVRLKDAAARGSHLVQTGDGRRPIRTCENHFPGKTLEREVEPLLRTDAMHELRHDSVAGAGEPKGGQIKGVSVMLTASQDSPMAGQTPNGCETKVRESEERGVQELWSARDSFRVQERNGGGAVSHETVPALKQEHATRPNQQRWMLCTGKCPFRDTRRKQSKQAHDGSPRMESGRMAVQLQRRDPEAARGIDAQRDFHGCGKSRTGEAKKLARDCKKVAVYDLLNAGPRHRFTVSGKLVHNCGYGGGVGALKAFGADKMGLSDEELTTIVERWRAASPEIPKLWHDIEAAAIRCINEGKGWKKGVSITFSPYGRFSWAAGKHLVMHLPSGRVLVYPNARLGMNRFGSASVLYDGLDQTSRKWGEMETYGGKLTENFIQAIARDCLGEAMLRLESAGYPIVAHIHDEVVIDARKEVVIPTHTLKGAIEVMTRNEPWNEGLLMNADGFTGEYYKKE